MVGEAPGLNEDRLGRPFVGAAGKFLNQLLELAGLRRDEIFITNVVKCRPPGNRDPNEDEIRICTSNFLRLQFQIIRPRLSVALGRFAGSVLLEREVVMSKEHGKIYPCNYAGVEHRLFLTYHPAAGLYGAKTKQKLITDFRILRSVVKSLE
jgi:DNA polymerase